MRNILMPLSFFCIAICIVIGSWLISGGLKASKSNPVQVSNSIPVQPSETYNKLLTQGDLASYLGISLEDSKKLGPIPMGNGDSTSILPYIKLGNNIYYSKAAIDKWLTNNGQGTVNN